METRDEGEEDDIDTADNNVDIETNDASALVGQEIVSESSSSSAPDKPCENIESEKEKQHM